MLRVCHNQAALPLLPKLRRLFIGQEQAVDSILQPIVRLEAVSIQWILNTAQMSLRN